MLAASGVSPFELGLGIVRRLVEERSATVLDYDVTPDGGVVNLRVQAPLGTRAAWIRSRSSVLLKAADVLQVRTEVARASLTRTLAERSRLLLEVRAHRSALRESRVRLGEETSRLKHSYGRARDLVGAGASLGRPGEPSAA